MQLSGDVVAALIDHAVLGPAQGSADLEEGCSVARQLGTASVCCKPAWLGRCAELLDGSAVLPSTVADTLLSKSLMCQQLRTVPRLKPSWGACFIWQGGAVRRCSCSEQNRSCLCFIIGL